MNPNPASTILVVDDEVKAQNLLRNLLEAEGYRVVCAGNGLEAIAAAARALPDVVLLDLMMPGIDGYEVCTRLRALPAIAAVPIIMLTALDDRASRLRGLQAGADDFLSKPFDSAELRARVRTITRLNRYRRLYDEQARFEAALAHAPEPIVLAELDGTIVHRNAAFSALLDPAQPLAASFFDYLPPAVAEQLRADLAAGPAHPARESRLHGSRRASTVVEITHGLIPWEGRRIVQFHLRDLTERKLLEAQLLRSQRIELLGQLAGSVVHDINNILTVIGGSTTLLTLDPASAPRHVQNIQAGVLRGGSMLRQLLMFARGSDGEVQPMNPAETVGEVASLVSEAFGNIYEIRFNPAAGPATIAADSTQLHQIVMNLCVNARDAMPDGGRLDLATGRATVDSAAATRAGPGVATGEYVTVSVRDNGTGIPPEVLPRLFDPFFTTKPEGKGTGLGLATVMRLMRRHHGFVTIDTEIGKGTCFTCHFPLTPPTAAAQTRALA